MYIEKENRKIKAANLEALKLSRIKNKPMYRY